MVPFLRSLHQQSGANSPQSQTRGVPWPSEMGGLSVFLLLILGEHDCSH